MLLIFNRIRQNICTVCYVIMLTLGSASNLECTCVDFFFTVNYTSLKKRKLVTK